MTAVRTVTFGDESPVCPTLSYQVNVVLIASPMLELSSCSGDVFENYGDQRVRLAWIEEAVADAFLSKWATQEDV